MKVKVFGTKKYDFKDKNGVQRTGITAHYMNESNNVLVKGMEYGKFGAAIDKPMYGIIDNLSLPADLDLEFDRYGNVIDFEVL